MAAGKEKDVVAMSKVVLDIKPWDDETDLAAMEAAVRGVTAGPEGGAVEWQAAERVPIGFGLEKVRAHPPLSGCH